MPLSDKLTEALKDEGVFEEISKIPVTTTMELVIEKLQKEINQLVDRVDDLENQVYDLENDRDSIQNDLENLLDTLRGV